MKKGQMKLGIGALVTMLLLIVVGATFVQPVVTGVNSASDFVRDATSTADWNDGTLTNLTTTTSGDGEDAIELSQSNTTGTYTSQVYSAGGDDLSYEEATGEIFVHNATDTTVDLTIDACSNEDCSSISDTTTTTLSNGTNTIDISALSNSPYFRVTSDHSRTAGTSPLAEATELESWTVDAEQVGTNFALLGLLILVFIVGIVGAAAAWAGLA